MYPKDTPDVNGRFRVGEPTAVTWPRYARCQAESKNDCMLTASERPHYAGVPCATIPEHCSAGKLPFARVALADALVFAPSWVRHVVPLLQVDGICVANQAGRPPSDHVSAALMPVGLAHRLCHRQRKRPVTLLASGASRDRFGHFANRAATRDASVDRRNSGRLRKAGKSGR